MVGNNFIHFRWYSTTVAILVCWAIISETQMEYGSRGLTGEIGSPLHSSQVCGDDDDVSPPRFDLSTFVFFMVLASFSRSVFSLFLLLFRFSLPTLPEVSKGLLRLGLGSSAAAKKDVMDLLCLSSLPRGLIPYGGSSVIVNVKTMSRK